jgi:hypothetical protein
VFYMLHVRTEHFSLSCQGRIYGALSPGPQQYRSFLNPILFAICTSTFGKLCVTYTLTCRRELSSTPLKVAYMKSIRTSQETHNVTVTETNRLMMFKETVAVYYENHTQIHSVDRKKSFIHIQSNHWALMG